MPQNPGVSVDTTSARRALERGRAAYAQAAWVDAYESLQRADEALPLGPDDLELLARAAYMLGRDEDYLRGLERAHYGHLDAGDMPLAPLAGTEGTDARVSARPSKLSRMEPRKLVLPELVCTASSSSRMRPSACRSASSCTSTVWTSA